MGKNFTREYIEIANEFRKSKASAESIGKLYDLLNELENANRTKSDDLTRSYIYSLLGFHQSAYDIFKSVADLTDRKNRSKLYVLEEKAKSHQNNFIIKDIRKFRRKQEPVKLSLTDFMITDSPENKYGIISKDIIIFNKVVKSSKFEISLPEGKDFDDEIVKIINYIYWLSDCKDKLIGFYNAELSKYTGETANEDWYNTLEILGVRIIAGQNGNLYAEIAGGDDFAQDHILDIETENETITSMSYDG